MKIPRITRETIERVSAADGGIDADEFKVTQPEVMKLADELEGKGGLTDLERSIYLTGAMSVLRFIEVQLESSEEGTISGDKAKD